MRRAFPGSPPPAAVSILAFLVILLPAWLGFRHAQPPEPLPASSPADIFSSDRAMAHIRRIAERPHPTGSGEITAVRGYITGVLQGLGLQPEIQTATALRAPAGRGHLAVGATVHNIVGRLKGRSDKHPVLMLTHYDSVPTGPGAGDAASAVAALLETARALKAGPALRNDLIFLVTDGEELGLLGARAFHDEHPWGKTAAVVLNFEARGTCGPSLMFETGKGNAAVIRAFLKAAPNPVTSSVMYDFYQRLPNDTDFSIFRREGFPGLNFAFTGCWEHYHTQEDRISNVDPRSLQHQGEYALSLARHFGNSAGPFSAGHDRVFFSLPGGAIHYADRWVPPIALFCLLAWSALLWLGWRRDRLHPGWVLAGLAVWLAGAAAAAALPHFAWQALKSTSLANMLPYGMAYNSRIYAAGFALISLAVLLVVQIFIRRKAGSEGMAMGALSWLLLLTLLSSFLLPGGSYAFAWPMLAGLAALGFALFCKYPLPPLASCLTWALPAATAGLLLSPVIHILNFTLATGGVIPTAVLVSAWAAALAPVIHIAFVGRQWPAPAASASAALALLLAGASASGYDARRPQADSLFYVLDTASGRAHWVSLDQEPDEWTSGFLGAHFEKTNLREYLPFEAPVLRSEAPALHVEPAATAVLEDKTSGSLRIVCLQIAAPRRPRALLVRAASGSLLAASAEGKIVELPAGAGEDKTWSLYFVGVPEHGLLLDLAVPAGRPTVLEIVEQFDGLPAFSGVPAARRPAGLMPSPAAIMDSSTLVRSTFALPEPGPSLN